MPITQILLTANSGTPNSAVGDYTWDNVSSQFIRPVPGSDPLLIQQLMPDGVTTKNIHSFSGTGYITTQAHNATGDFYFNIWFYPVSSNVSLMSELGGGLENAGFHYNMLEIDSSNNVRAGTWNGSAIVFITTTTTVTTGAWNHLYFYYSTGTLTLGISVNGGTENTLSTSRSGPIGPSYFGIGTNDTSSIVTANRFQGDLGDVVVNTFSTGSNYEGTKAVYGIA